MGKTEIIHSLADEIGAELYDLRLTTIEPQDLRGLPFYDHAAGKTVWYWPEDLPDTDAPAILFLDELTAAAPSLQSTVYGLLQERRVGRHRLPDSVFIVAAGNTVDDGAVAYDMGTALSDRLVHMVVQADADDWVRSYAPDAEIHPTVAAFIRTRPDLLETTDSALHRGDTIACTPLAWTRVSAIMGVDATRATRQVMIAGTVGEAAAAEFALIADEIEASVQIDAMLVAPQSERLMMYPVTLHAMTAMIFGLIGAVDAERLPVGIKILNDLRGLDCDGLTVTELATFGFEMLIARALDQGWHASFAASDGYADYARDRAAAGLP